MKNTYLFILAAFLLVSACKKDEDQEPAAECPANNTFVKEISQYVGLGELISIQEASDGTIHVEVRENGIWKVYQFSSSGTFAGSVNLGSYANTKTLKVYDAYYTTSYIEATVPPNQTDSNSYQLQGWIQVGSYSYNSNVDSCGPVISYGTWDYSPTVIDTHTATTTIQKRSFEGNMLWSNTVEATIQERVL